MKKIIYVTFFLSLFFVACSKEETPEPGFDNNNIELSLSINNYIKNITKAESNGTEEEQTVNDLYVFLFPTTGSQTLIKYYISGVTFTGGSWNSSTKKVSLNLTQAEAGNRNVYIIANCSTIKTNLDGVSAIEDLQAIWQTVNNPWSANITPPLLMSGNKTHDFNTNYQLNNVSLVRALAKVQLNVKLSAQHYSIPVVDSKAQYSYKYIDFDKNTYVFKPSTKTDNLVSSNDWTAWSATGSVSSYTLDQGNVTNLTLTTYINERDNASSAIEIKLPYQATGALPPPEFGDETYKLLLPSKIERNHWYVYDVEI